MSTIPKLNVEPVSGIRWDRAVNRTAAATKLLVPIEFHYEWDWLTAFNFSETEFSVVALRMGSEPDTTRYRERIIDQETSILEKAGEMPSFLRSCEFCRKKSRTLVLFSLMASWPSC